MRNGIDYRIRKHLFFCNNMAANDVQGGTHQQECPQESMPKEPEEEVKVGGADRSTSKAIVQGEARHQQGSQHKRPRRRPFIPRAELLILSAIVSACIAFLIYYNHEESPETRLFTDEQLSLFTGERNSPMFLAILGEVFDVTKGRDKYGKDGYNFFLGKDATKSYVTGNFRGDLHDDVRGLSNEQCASLVEWRAFFREHPDYKYKGRVLGRFWNVHGKKRKALIKVEEQAAKAKTQEALAKEADAKLVACNVRWNEASGGTVWCEDGWHPRLVVRGLDAEGGEPTQRCACFESIGWSDVRKVYPGCKPESSECRSEPSPAQSHHHQQQRQPIKEEQQAGDQRGQQKDRTGLQRQMEIENAASNGNRRQEL